MQRLSVLGCNVDTLGCRDAVRAIVEFAKGSGRARVVTLGTEMIVRAQSDDGFRRVINDSDLSLCDTVGVLMVLRMKDARLTEPVTGVDLIEPLCASLATEGLSVYFLGAKGDTAERAARAMRERFPGLQVAGWRDGYFRPEEEAAVAQQIAATGAKLVLVALGSPRQEFWLDRNLAATGCHIGIGVGGAFDILAGNVKRAPVAWRRYQLEWLYRLIQQPWRLRRQLALPKFLWLVFREAVLGVELRFRG